MIKKEDIDALRAQLKVGDVVEVKVTVTSFKNLVTQKRVLRRIRRKHRHLVELEGPGYDTATYVEIMMNRLEKLTAMEEAHV